MRKLGSDTNMCNRLAFLTRLCSAQSRPSQLSRCFCRTIDYCIACSTRVILTHRDEWSLTDAVCEVEVFDAFVFESCDDINAMIDVPMQHPSDYDCSCA